MLVDYMLCGVDCKYWYYGFWEGGIMKNNGLG